MKILALLAAVFLCACTTVKVSESQVLHPKKSISLSDVAEFNYTIGEVAIRQTDGVMSRGIHLKTPGARVTVIYFGGNQFHIDMAGRIALMPFVRSGVNVVSFDHRGYGRSDGKPSIELLGSDALNAYDYVRKNFDGKVVVYGYSLGSFIASHVASKQAIDALILEGSTTSTSDWAQSLIPWYAKPFANVEVDQKLLVANNLKALQSYQGPLLVVHGSNDSLTPPALAKKLYNEIPSAKKHYTEIAGYGHGNLGSSTDYQTALTSFLSAL